MTQRPELLDIEMVFRQIPYHDIVDHLSLPDAVNALRDGQWLCKAQVLDIFLGPAEETPLSRSAWIRGLGYGVNPPPCSK